MEKLKNYIKKVLGIDLEIQKISSHETASMPLYLRNMFDIYRTYFLTKEVMLVYAKDINTETKQIEKQSQNLFTFFNSPVIMVLEDISSIARRRLINKGVNFIVPGKQMFLPELLMDLRETYKGPYKREDQLLPSAQVILIYNLLNRDAPIENYSLKELAQKFDYTPMALTKAANNLHNHEICDIKGTKEKYLYFKKDKRELWNEAQNLLVNPVYKQVFVDELPENTDLYKSNESALTAYTELAERSQFYHAIPKAHFYQLQREERLRNLNEEEGRYCLEIWKYNPGIITQKDYVDPLSLYLSLKDNNDERIQMALEQILKTYIW
ncbi:MAG: MarR family transcriptional regulator [Candidatus Woesearchaeota archaeon]